MVLLHVLKMTQHVPYNIAQFNVHCTATWTMLHGTRAHRALHVLEPGVNFYFFLSWSHFDDDQVNFKPAIFRSVLCNIYKLTWLPQKCRRASRSRSASKPCHISSRFAIVEAPRWMQLIIYVFCFFLLTVFRGKSIILAIRRMLVDVACYCLTSTRCRSMLLFDEHSLMQHVTVWRHATI